MSKILSNFAPDFEREIRCPGGGMVDAVDSKSAVSNGVWVQVPPGVQIFFSVGLSERIAHGFFIINITILLCKQ